MKYIVYIGDFGLEIPVIFPDFVNHNEIIPKFKKAVSAGIINLHEEEDENGENQITAFCSGQSISLGIKSRGKEDNELVERSFKFRV